MATTEIPSMRLQRNPRGFMTLLSSAACEWLLMFLMFINGAFSYLLMKFAHYCELQTPCILCSRLEHVFGSKCNGCYQDLCGNHRTEISSLVSCAIHNKLADAREMCEECLMSFAKGNFFESESHRLFLSDLGVDSERSCFSQKKFIPAPLNSNTCSCCNRSWRDRSNAQRFLQLSPIGSGASVANVRPPLPRASGRNRLSRRNSMKKIRDNLSSPMTRRRRRSTSIDSLSHVGYTELKITSDSESEFPFSEDEDGSFVVHKKIDPNKKISVQHGSRNVPKTQASDQISDYTASLSDQSVKLEENKPSDMKSLRSNVMDRSLGDLTCEHSNAQINALSHPEFISLNGVPSLSGVVESRHDASLERSKPNIDTNNMSSLLVLSELMSLNDASRMSNVTEARRGVLQDKLADVSGASDNGPVSNHSEISLPLNTTTVASLANDLMQTTNDMDLTNAIELSVSNKGRELPGKHAEQVAINNSARSSENSKLLLQTSSAQEIDQSKITLTPRANSHYDGLQTTGASSPIEIQALHTSPSLERHDSDHEYLTGGSISEIEGESAIDKLRRQLEYDKKCMNSLYKELEEERSAAAVAANQAMAMITRLQGEKAALRMEALQYLRMVEEQAEYDMEALAKANDLLAEKEKEIQDLEEELEFCRSKIPDELVVDNLHKQTCNHNTDTCIGNCSTVPSNFMHTKESKGDRSANRKASVLDFGEEKLYISEHLKKIERKLNQAFGNRVSCNEQSIIPSAKMPNGLENQKDLPSNQGNQRDNQMEQNGLPTEHNQSTSNGSPSSKDCSIAVVVDNHIVFYKNGCSDSDQQKVLKRSNDVDLRALETEILDINDRLEALEADRNFLEHAFNSFQSGSDGLLFIQEIASRLDELRKIAVKT